MTTFHRTERGRVQTVLKELLNGLLRDLLMDRVDAINVSNDIIGNFYHLIYDENLIENFILVIINPVHHHSSMIEGFSMKMMMEKRHPNQKALTKKRRYFLNCFKNSL